MSILTRRNFLGSVAAAGGLAALQKVVGAGAGGADRRRSHPGPANPKPDGQKMSDFLRILDTPGTRISGLTIDGDAQNQNERQVGAVLVRADNCIIEDCEIFNCSADCIYVQRGKNLKVRHNYIHNTWRRGVSLYGGDTDFSGMLISDNMIANTGYESIQIGGRGVVVQGNKLGGQQGHPAPFGGLYALTGSKDFKIIGNTIQDGYGGLDLSWGKVGGRVGTDLTNRIIRENTILRCGIGIGTGGNGTVIINNIITDCGAGQVQTYTLLNVAITVAAPGGGYSVGDVLTFTGGNFILPGKVKVEQVNPQGGILAVSVWYLGVYTATPANPIEATGGSGTDAAFSIARWNARKFNPVGITIVDASDCIVQGNISGNSVGNTTQRLGCWLQRVVDAPQRNLITGNNFARNTKAAIAGYLAGNTTTPNIT